MLFVNDGTGEHFLDVSALTGTDAVGDSKGVAAADYDADGALDLFVVDQSGAPHLYRNVTHARGPSLARARPHRNTIRHGCLRSRRPGDRRR